MMPEKVPVPRQMQHLPVDPVKGLPVPWFVARLPDGRPEWRAADSEKRAMALALRYCWVCGYKIREPAGHFALGPMCGLNRVSAEPASHRECALYSVQVCPFLTRPRMARRRGEGEEELGENMAGFMIERNPGCMAIWSTPDWRTVDDGDGGLLVRLGDPEEVTWWAEGRPATRAEVITSIVTGLPHLASAGINEEGWEVLARSWVELDRLLPR